jgi:hypothetical protein
MPLFVLREKGFQENSGIKRVSCNWPCSERQGVGEPTTEQASVKSFVLTCRDLSEAESLILKNGLTMLTPLQINIAPDSIPKSGR